MAQSLPLPDGTSVTIREGETPEETWARAIREYPEAFQPPAPKEEKGKPESGFFPALKSSASALKSDVASLAGRAGLMDLAKAEQIRKESEEYQKQTFAPTQEGWTEAPFTKFKELAGGSLPYMAAPVAAGMLAPEGALGLGIAGLTSATQFAGSNLSRQMDEGKTLAQTNLQSAALAAVPQAALDVVALRMIPGIRNIFGALGKEMTEAEAQAIAKQGLAKTLGDYALSTGKTAGVEGLTEAGQQVFERLQAGLSLTDPQAREEYFQNFLGGAVLGGTLAPVGRYSERGDEQRKAQALLQQKPAPIEAAGIPEPTLRGEQPEETAAGTEEAAILKEALAPKKKAAMDKQLAKEQQEYLKKYQALATQREADQAERERIAAMSPEEFAAEKMQGVGKQPKVKPVDQDELAALGYQTQLPFVSGEVENYTRQQLALAKDREAAPDIGAYVSYLMVKPDMARQVAMSGQPVPGLSVGQSHKVKSVLLTTLEKQDKEAAKAAEQAKQAGYERGQQLLTQSGSQTNQDLLSAARQAPGYPAKEWERAERERVETQEKAEQNRIAKLTPEEYKAELSQVKQEALPEGEEPALTDENDPLIAQLMKALPTDQGRIVPGQVYEGLGVSRGTLKDLQLQLAIARMSGNTLVARRLQAELDDQRKSLKEPVEKTATGEKSAGLPNITPESGAKQVEADKFADAQRSIMLGLVKTLNTRNPLNPSQTRRSATLSLPGVFEKRVSDAKEAFVAAHTNEIEARRAVFGLPPMANWERAEARARALEALNELEKRWNTFGAPVEAIQVLQQQVRDATNENLLNAAKRFNTEKQAETREKLVKPGQKYTNYKGETIEVPQEKGPRIVAPKELKLSNTPRIPADDKAAALKFIETVLRSVERRVRGVPVSGEKAPTRVGSMEDIAKLFEQEKTNGATEKTDPATVELLHRLRDHLETSNDPEFISLAREQAQQVMEGNLPNPFAVRDLNEMMLGQAVSGRSAAQPLSAEDTAAVARGEKKYEAQPQKELFPEANVQVTRATPKNFQKMLDSKDIQGMRDALVKQKEENTAALELIKKYMPSLQKEMKAATTALNNALAKKKTLTKSAAEALQEPTWYAPAVRKIVELESALQAIPPRLDSLRSIQRAVKGLSPEDRASLLQLTEEAHKTASTPDSRADFNEIIKALKSPEAFNAEIKMLNDAVKNAAGLVDTARNALDNLMVKYQKGSVMRGSFERAADKATQQVERLTEKYNALKRQVAQERAAQEEKVKAEIVPEELKATPRAEYETAAQRGREGMGLPGVRAEKDTMRMRENMHNIRSEIGSLNEELRKAEKKNDTDRIEEVEAKIADAEARLASVYRDAPLNVREVLTPEEERDARAAESRRAAEDAVAEAKRRKRKGEKAPKIVPTEQTALLKEVRGSKITQPYKTARIAEAAEKVTDRLIKQKTELAELQRRIAYLKDNNKHKVAGRLTDTFKDLQGKEALLKEKLKSTQATQSKIVSVEKTAETLANKEAQKQALSKAKKEDERFARGVEVESPDLTATQRRSIESNDVVAAYSDIANDSSASKVNRAVAQRLAEMLAGTNIRIQDKVVDKNGNEVLGSATSKQITLNRNGGLTQEILLHEGTHAATERVLQMDESKLTRTQLIAKRELMALHKAVQNDPRITSVSAKESLSEFAAEVLSNRNLQEQLREKKWKLSDAWAGFKSIILRLLGIDHPETMLGAALQSVDAIMVPSNVKLDVKERAVNRRLSQKDIAALHTGSNSMKQFADQFGQDIKQKDRTPEDVERIAKDYLVDMERNPENYVTMPYTIRDLMRRNAVRTKEQDAALEKIKELRTQLAKDEAAYRDGEPYDESSEHYKEITKQLEKQKREIDILETKMGSLDYFEATKMSDGKQYDPESPLHYVEADAITFANLEAQSNGLLRDNEARSIRNKRAEDLQSLVQLMSTNLSYTLAENALVAKAASKFAVVTDKTGRLKVASIANNNRNGVAVVSLDAADSIIRELRAGKNLKEAFLDGMQASADRAIKENSRKEGWQKFNQTKREETAQSLAALYTDEEFNEAFGQTGYDIENENELIEMLIADGLLPDRRNKLSNTQTNFEQAAIELNKACAGTPWCTGRDENYARDHIAGGDFYVYYKQGRPEVAVRMNGQDQIGEIRGNSLNQALNKEQQEITKNFLNNSNFSETDKYLTQFKLKQKAIEVAKGEATFTTEDLVNTDVVYNGKVDASSLLDFRMIDGYRGRSDITEAVEKFFENKILKAVEDAYEDGHFIGARIAIMGDGINDIKLNNKKYTPTLDQVKTAESISVYSTSGKSRLPNLENVNALLIHGDTDYNTELDLPRVKHIEVINAYGKAVDAAVIKLAPGATVDLIREGVLNKPSHITVEGVSFVKSFSAGTKESEKLFVKLPDAKYVGEHNDDVAVYAPNRVADKPPIEEMVERDAEEPRYARAQAKGFEDELNVASQVIAKPKTVGQQIKANLGLGFRTQFLDRLAPLHQVAKDMLEPLKGMQMMHYLLASDQRMSYVQQAVGNGVPQRVAYKRPDGRTEYIVESVGGANLANVVRTLAKAPGMNGEAANQLFTLYLLGKRADRVGYDKLNFSVNADLIKSSVRNIESNKALRDVFEEARTEYNEYNKNLMHFLKDTGVLPPSVADDLASTNDYIPYYRERNGNAELVIGKEGVYKIGNLADQPQLRELIGGEDKILDFATSSVQNTSMIMDVGLRNLASKNAMYELVGLDLAQFLGKDTAAPNVVRFKDKGEEKFVQVATDAVGIPADLLVKGMEGIPVNTNALVRAMGFASSAVRKGVMLNPLYPVRQILRDSVAAPLLAGADFAGPLGALRALGNSATKQKLEARAITGGQVYTGTNTDLSRILKDLMGGRMGLSQFVAKAEAIAMEADAATRRAQYDSYIRQGLSQMEATVMALESMNFNKRGLSPSMHLAATMIPFFNSQLQGLDVLWRAASGQLPMSERLDIQGKLLRRGSLVMATAVAYALMMQDDEAYKNARPDEKYGNFFIRIPGLDEPIRFPVPFEIGYILKGIPEAIVNTMVSKHGGEEAMQAFKHIAIQTIPGGSSMLMPALVKPMIENATNYSFFGQRELETQREQKLLPQQRFRDNTSELAKELGAMVGYSPIKIDNLIRGYTGTMGLAAAQAVSFAMPEKLGPQEATKRLSDTPVIGSMFQPNDAGGIINATYDRMEHIMEVKRTYDDMIKKGETAEARAFLQENVNEIASASVAGNARTQLTKITQAMNAVKASNMSPDEKRATLDRLQKIRIKIADTMRGVLDKTAPQ